VVWQAVEAELEACRATLATAHESVAHQGSQYAAQITELQQELNLWVQERMRVLEERAEIVKHFQAETTRLDHEKQAAETQLQQMNRMHQDSLKTLEEQLRHALESKRTLALELEARAAQQQALLSSLHAANDRNKELEQRVATAHQKLVVADERKTAMASLLEAHKIGIAATSVNVESLAAQLHDRGLQVKLLQDELTAAREKARSLDQKLGTAKQSEVALASLRTEYKGVQQQLETLKVNALASAHQVKTLSNEISTLTTENRVLQTAASTATAEVARCKKDLEQQQQFIGLLEEGRAFDQSRAKQLEAAVEESKRKCAEADTRFAAMRTKWEAVCVVVDETQRQYVIFLYLRSMCYRALRSFEYVFCYCCVAHQLIFGFFFFSGLFQVH
jgi:chromosome segregation ATPase